MRIIACSLPSPSASLVTQFNLHSAIVIFNAIGCHLMSIVDRLILPSDEFFELNHEHLKLLISVLTLHSKANAHIACNINSNFRNTLNKIVNIFLFAI